MPKLYQKDAGPGGRDAQAWYARCTGVSDMAQAVSQGGLTLGSVRFVVSLLSFRVSLYRVPCCY